MLAQRAVEIIPANTNLSLLEGRPTKLRVAAYCRVSTDNEEQLTSFETQIGYFTEKINSNNDWINAGIFADEGKSGTSTKARTQFNKMIKLCDQGKIDLVITKSISRFSRNNLVTIETARRLREHNVGILFEQDNINTLDMSNEMFLSFKSAMAQSESENISLTVKSGIRMGYKSGKVNFQCAKLFGYYKGEDGEPAINQHEAEIVKNIYERYLNGASLQQIANHVNTLGTKIWSVVTIKNVLQNEKYCGNVLLQKTFIADPISKRVVKNTGQLPQYLVRNNHPGIISEDVFNRVAEEMARRSNKRKVSTENTAELGKYSGKYALTELLYCGECGSSYQRRVWTRPTKHAVWRCVRRLYHGTKYCHHSPTIKEESLHRAIVEAINQFKSSSRDIQKVTSNVTRETVVGNDEITELRSQIDILNNNMIELVSDGLAAGLDDEALDNECAKIADEISMLQQKLNVAERNNNMSDKDVNLEDILAEIAYMPLNITEYVDALVRRVVASVKVVSSKIIVIRFKSGDEVEVLLG